MSSDRVFPQSACFSLHQRSQPRSSVDRGRLTDSVKIGRPTGVDSLHFPAYTAGSIYDQFSCNKYLYHAKISTYQDQRKIAKGADLLPLQIVREVSFVRQPCHCHRPHNAAGRREAGHKLNTWLQMFAILRDPSQHCGFPVPHIQRLYNSRTRALEELVREVASRLECPGQKDCHRLATSGCTRGRLAIPGHIEKYRL
jgi:hypothetical protein